MRYDYNINEMLEDHFSTQLDRVIGVTLQGSHYLMDYVKFTHPGEPDQVVDDFTYDDSPENFGWVSHFPQSTGFASVMDPELGHSCLMVTGATPINVSEGTDMEGIDFSLKTAGSISGTVMDEKDDAPIPGVNVTFYMITEGLKSPDPYFTGPFYQGSFTDKEGKYTITGLLPGIYKIKAKEAQLRGSTFIC